MATDITLSWEWIFGIFITLIMAFISWILKQYYNFKKETEQRLRFLEIENSSKTTKLDLLEKISLKPFEKGEKKK